MAVLLGEGQQTEEVIHEDVSNSRRRRQRRIIKVPWKRVIRRRLGPEFPELPEGPNHKRHGKKSRRRPIRKFADSPWRKRKKKRIA